jgi:hypothetical protein
MVQALINTESILENIRDEEYYLEESSMESLYAIRKLTAALRCAYFNQSTPLGEPNEHGQRYSEVYLMWFNEEEYTII